VPEIPAVPGIVPGNVGAELAPPGPTKVGPYTVATTTTTVAEVFAPDGLLARALPGFEPRAGQAEMADAVARAFAGGGVLLAEAGTGTGKTLAYLVPAILSRQRVLISTGTKNLQEQIFFKDIPALRDALGIPFTATYMKGRANYLCLHKLDQLSEGVGPRAVSVSHDVFLPIIREWSARTGTGDRAELEDLPEDLAFWNDVSATAETCLGGECPRYDDCFVTRMRQRAASSDLVIVNHHLLCADAAVRQNAYGEVIPACSQAVVDEAHQLEDVATQYFGLSVSTYRLEELARDVERSLLAIVGKDRKARDDVVKSIERLRDHARAFFNELACAHRPSRAPRGRESTLEAEGRESSVTRERGWGPASIRSARGPSEARVRETPSERERGWGPASIRSARGPSEARVRETPSERERGWGPASIRNDDRVRATPESLAEASEAAAHLTGALDIVESTLALVRLKPDPAEHRPRPDATVEDRADDVAEDIAALARRAGELRGELRFLLRADDPEYVFFVEFRGRGVFLRAAPIDVSKIVRELLLDRMRTTVLTSATLTVDGTFEYIRDRLGIRRAEELRLPSEFDFARQAILYLPPRMPDPRSPDFPLAAGREVIEILRRTEGRAFVLFTSYAMLRAVQAIAELAISYPILVQGTAPRSQLLKQFRETPHAVLLATASFWQGVDVIGDALSCVIIDKLPFASPGDPITAARIDAIRARGGEPFAEYQVPLAVLTLQQGLGRLIRHRRDRGVLAVLDPRLRTKQYGRRFIDSLPPAPVVHALADIERFFHN
jgi:ATP-dependent DNA helicase DinG